MKRVGAASAVCDATIQPRVWGRFGYATRLTVDANVMETGWRHSLVQDRAYGPETNLVSL